MQYNVYDFGAIGDGHALDTQAIQQAIDACSAEGGGRVLLAGGTFLTGTLFMKSNVELHLAVNAVLSGSSDINDYSRETHKQLYRNESHMDRCLVYSLDVQNIALTGRGMINGQGEKFHTAPSEGGHPERPMLLRYVNCKNIRLEGLRLRNPASWTNAFIGCQDIWVDGLDIKSRANWNGDGLDFDHCENVFVSNCKLDCSDDCICLQNSETGKKCKNIVITNTLMRSKWAGMRIGLLSCGDIENVTVTNCIFQDVECSALKIQSAEGGIIKDMVFGNLVMENVQRPLFITLNEFRERVDMPQDVPPTGCVKNLRFHHIQACGMSQSPSASRSCMIIDGVPGKYVENIHLSDIQYTAVGGGSKPDAQRKVIPYHLGKRAECFNYEGPLPAYGLYARHVKGLSLSNVHIDTMLSDERPMVYREDCTDTRNKL